MNGKSTSILTSIKRFQPCSIYNISVGKLKVESRSCITLTVIYTTELLFPLSEKIRVVSLQDFVLTSMQK